MTVDWPPPRPPLRYCNRLWRSFPPRFCDLVEKLGDELGGAPEVPMPLDAGQSVARLGLALEAWPGLGAWVRQTRLKAVFLHRARTAATIVWPAEVGLLGSHDAFDRRYGFGAPHDLLDTLGLRATHALRESGGYPLGTVADGPLPSFDALVDALRTEFGGVETVGAPVGPAAAAPLVRVAFARAMSDALVREARALGAQAYVTGQLRRSARDAVADTGIGVVAVGHARSERWGLARLADALRVWRPALEVHVAPPDAG